MALDVEGYLSDLNEANPLGTDQRSTADDHIRVIKSNLRRTFAGLSGASAGASSITATTGRMNDVFVNAVMNNASNDYSGSVTQNFAGSVLFNPRLQVYTETVVSLGAVNSGASATLDLSLANNFTMTIGTNTLTLSFANWPSAGIKGTCNLEVTQDGTGSREFAYLSAVKWTGGVAPPISQSAGTVSSFSFTSRDAGTTIYGYQTGFDQQ